MKTLFSQFDNKLTSFPRSSSLLFLSLFCIPTLFLIISLITYFYVINPSALFALFLLLLLSWCITLLSYLIIALLIVLYYFMRSTYREYFVTQHLTVTSNKDFYIDPTTKVKFVWHPDGYYVGIPHKIYNIEDYIPVPSNNSYNVSETDYIAPKFPTIGNTSPFTNGGKRGYHTDISESLNDLDISIGPRPYKSTYKNKDKASKEFKKNWINWNYNLSSSDASLWDGGLKDILRSFWDEVLTNNPSDHIVLLTLRLKMSDGSTRFVKYVSFFTKDDKMFNRIHYILNKEFLDKNRIYSYKRRSKTNNWSII